MTRDEIYTLATSLNGGDQMDDELFDSLLAMAKDTREMERDWMKLRTVDRTITFASADTYLTTKSLPERFLRTYTIDPYDSGVFIVDSEGAKHPLTQISLEEAYDHRTTEGYFYLDLANDAICRTGSLAGTMHMHFLKGSGAIEGDTEWSFPSFAHPLLAFDIITINKGQIDWDTINQSQVQFTFATIRKLEGRLAMWDARLQQAALGK